MMIRKSFLFHCAALFIGVFLTIADSAAATIEVNPDRNPVRLNESFTLTFTAASSPDGDPDFSVMEENFEILNQGHSSNISVINGNFSKSITWTLNLMARKTGRLLVPPVSFGKDQSNPIPIEVLGSAVSDGGDNPELLLEVSAEPENPYVQAQVVYTVHFLRRVDIAQATLTEPALENAVVQKLGDDKTYALWRNAVQYSVTERKYAIFPQLSGLVAIPPLELNAEVVTSGQRRGFFSRPVTRMRRIESNAVALDVRPVPEQFKGDYWLPAEQVVLEEQWSNNPPSVRVGEPLTRTLKLTAVGAPLSLLPEFGKLRIEGTQGNRLKQYPDQPVLDEKKYFSGIVGSREQKVALIPSAAGNFRVQGQEIVWWNTKTDRMEVAQLPEVTINTLPSAVPSRTDPGTADSEIEDSGKVQAEKSPSVSVSGLRRASEEIWFWVSVFLALGWGLSLLLMLARKQSNRKKGEESEENMKFEGKRQAIKSLKKACRNDNPSEARDALLAWGGFQWPGQRLGNLDGLAQRCEGTLAREIRNLNRALYSRESEAWKGTACWEAFNEFVEGRPKRKEKKPNIELEPLFKA